MVKIYLEMKQYEIPWGVGEKDSKREKFKYLSKKVNENPEANISMVNYMCYCS